MGRICLKWLVGGLLLVLAIAVGIADAQTGGDTRLQIQLRHSDGAAVVGETVILERLPEGETVAPACVTEATGTCTWTVGRGLYQVLFDRPLDAVSALALAEGGLRGFGLTAGEADVVYSFSFHEDGNVYFDAAPEAAVPAPIIPTPEHLHGGAASPVLGDVTATPSPAGATPAPELTPVPDAGDVSGRSWRLLLFIGGGLAIGGGLHLWTRRRRRRAHPRMPHTRHQEDDHA